MTLDHNRLSVEALEKLATDLEKVLSVSESYPSLLMDLQGIVDESGHFTIFDPPDKVSSGESPGTRTRLATLKASILNVRALIAKKQSR